MLFQPNLPLQDNINLTYPNSTPPNPAGKHPPGLREHRQLPGDLVHQPAAGEQEHPHEARGSPGHLPTVHPRAGQAAGAGPQKLRLGLLP